MTDRTADAKALVTPPKTPGAAPAPKIVDVARRYRVSPFRQLKEMILLNRGPGRIASHEYYSIGLYDPAISWREKREYVGVMGSFRLNSQLSPSDLTRVRAFVRDKVMYAALLNDLGFAVPRTQAVAQQGRLFGRIPALASPAEIREFLLTQAEFPVFAKPASGSGSFGSALLAGVQDGALLLGDGRRIGLDDFCDEILQDYSDGFLFQSALVQHPAMSEVAGNAIGTVRVVTVRDQIQPRPLYALWKLPSPSAMSDNFWQSGSMVAEIRDGGVLGRCRIGTGLDGRWIDEHPVSGRRFDGFTVPFYAQALDIASRAHALFPEFGVIGWDIAVSPDGPVIIEANANPYHGLYQLAFGRGIRNPDFVPVFNRTAELSNSMYQQKKTLFEARNKAKSRKG